MARPPTAAGEPNGTRVLLECAEHADPDVIAGVLRRAGYEVTVCHGPDARHHCDALTSGACDDVDAADVVVNLLSTHTGDEIAATVARSKPGQGLVVEVGLPSTSRPEAPAWPEGVELIRTPITGDALLGAVERATRSAQPV